MDKILLTIEVLIGAFGHMWLFLLYLIGIIIGLFIGFGLPIILIGNFIEYILQRPDEEYRDLPKITFKAFHDFYSISPDTWGIEKDYVFKITSDRVLNFTFERKEYRKYMKFYKKRMNKLEYQREKVRQENKRQYDNKQTIKLLEVIQKEINDIKQQSIKEFEESAKITLEVQDRIKNNP